MEFSSGMTDDLTHRFSFGYDMCVFFPFFLLCTGAKKFKTTSDTERRSRALQVCFCCSAVFGRLWASGCFASLFCAFGSLLLRFFLLVSLPCLLCRLQCQCREKTSEERTQKSG